VLEREGRKVIDHLVSQSCWLGGACDVTTNKTHAQEQQHHLLLLRDVGVGVGRAKGGGELGSKIAVAVSVIYLGGVEPSQCLSQLLRISGSVDTCRCVGYVSVVCARTAWSMEVLCVECSRRSASRLEGQRKGTSLLVSF
jgi:hypothetical protein